MNLERAVLTGLILLIGAVVQSSAGFGAGLVAIPLLLWLGLPLPVAIPLVAGAALGQCTLGIWQHREAVQPRLSLTVALAQWALIPVGALVMTSFLMDRVTFARQSAGALIVALLLLQRFFKPEAREKRPIGLALLSGAGAGFLSGAIGMGGPPLVFFALSHDWSAARFRVFLWSQILLGVPVLLVILGHRAGAQVWEGFAYGALGIPIMALGSEIGRRLTMQWSAAQVQRAAQLLLVVLGVSALSSPWLSN